MGFQGYKVLLTLVLSLAWQGLQKPQLLPRAWPASCHLSRAARCLSSAAGGWSLPSSTFPRSIGPLCEGFCSFH